jgi:hypothetical protein
MGLALVGPATALPDGRIVAIGSAAGRNLLRTWSVEPGVPPTLGLLRDVDLGPSGPDGLDLAVCGSDAWVLVEGTLLRIDLGSGVVGGEIDTPGTRVDCGVGPSGASGVILAGGQAVLLDDDLDPIDSLDAGGAGDLALVDLGSGPEVGFCIHAPCTAERWSVGGVDHLAAGGTDGVSVRGPGGTFDLAGPGRVSVADADDDGNPDLLALLEGGTAVVLFRSTGEGWGDGEVFHFATALQPPIFVRDAGGDGHADLWAPDGSGNLWYSR